jgi:hypothetical protein
MHMKKISFRKKETFFLELSYYSDIRFPALKNGRPIWKSGDGYETKTNVDGSDARKIM